MPVVWSDARGTVKNTFRENERKKGDEGRTLRRDSADGTFSAMALKRQAQLGISRFGVVLLALLAAVRARTATGPVRRLAWDFEQGGDRLASNAGGGVTAAARGCGRAQGVRGRALALDGRHGMVIPASTGFHARTGMTLECCATKSPSLIRKKSVPNSLIRLRRVFSIGRISRGTLRVSAEEVGCRLYGRMHGVQ